MKKWTIGIAAVALAATGTAFAAQETMRKGPDANGDGVITSAESQAKADAMFARMDANNDGKIDQADREARQADRKAKMFAAMDADGNGAISRDEFMSHERPHRRMGKNDGDNRDARWGGKRGHRGGMMAMAKMADTNNDGAISKAEFEAAHAKHFAMMDGNGDGRVTKEERQAAREQMKAQWKQNRADRSGS
ncbi:EF-hand domain-containing protein [Novosphingobium aquimarinum]|uniref:EF-hand domain-containing protein n=1 Tax=Novosphingobium aquimarinum TaxID=2682494 RepID=UPI0012EC52E6|nr:EF-hand domain-containing protein [Novosphingobium aquimarinum]